MDVSIQVKPSPLGKKPAPATKKAPREKAGIKKPSKPGGRPGISFG